MRSSYSLPLLFTSSALCATWLTVAAPPAARAGQTGARQPAQSSDSKPAQGDKKTDGKADGKTSDKPADKSADKSAAPRPIRPGKDRWLVKTASDPDVHDVVPTPQKTTIEDLLDLPRSVDIPLQDSNPTMQEHRARPVETTVYSVEADVVQCQMMPDGDYRVVLRGAAGKTIVMEMPNPAPDFVDPKSPFAAQIRQARVSFDGKIQPERQKKDITGHVRITGIGYWGRAYGSAVPDTNLIQLHPILNVEWLAKPSRNFNATKAAADKNAPKPAASTPTPAKADPKAN